MVNVYIMRIYADVIERGAKKLEDIPNDEMRAAVSEELNRRKELRDEQSN